MTPIRFSLILPTRNGMPYVQTAIESVLQSDSTDFELIISDDHSEDGTFEYLSSISDRRLKLVRTPKRLSLSEHWEFALSQSSGEWRMFIGQDDAIQPYFFQHAEAMIRIATSKGIRAICSRRAYLFWPGCEQEYVFRAHYYASKTLVIRNSWFSVISSLFGQLPYHELPQMYTNSMIHESLLEEASNKQGGRIFISHPQDSNLAAIALTLDARYLRSETPLGWVGTSPSSAGLAISRQAEGKASTSSERLAEEYSSWVSKSEIEYPNYAGSFGFGDTSIYFWQALIQSSKYLGGKFSFLKNPFFSAIFLTVVWSKNLSKESRSDKKKSFVEILDANHIGYLPVTIAASILRIPFWLSKTIRLNIAKILTSRPNIKLGALSGFNILAKNSLALNFVAINADALKTYKRIN